MILSVRWYLRFKLSYRDLAPGDERVRYSDRSFHHLALGYSLCRKLRRVLATVSKAGAAILAL
jgi:hypothetical protein